MRCLRILATFTLLVAAAAGRAQEAGQEPAPPAEPPKPPRPLSRWSLSLTFAGQAGGPMADIESSMRAGALDQPASRVTEGYLAHPYRSGGDFAWPVVTAGYRIKPRFELRLQAAMDREFAHVEGYHGPNTSPPRFGPTPTDRAYLTVTPSILTFAALASYEISSLRVAAGPSLNRTRLEFDDGSATSSEDKSSVGLVVDVGVEHPPRRRAMMVLWAQYHLVPSQEFGPVPVAAGGRTLATLPAGSASFSHFAAGLGIGFRFGRLSSGLP